MLSFIAVWMGLVDLVIAGYIVWAWLAGRPGDGVSSWLIVCLYGGAGTLTLAIISLWINRKESSDTPGVSGQRVQAVVAIVLALLAIAACYAVALISGQA